MDADFAVELGADDETLEFPWAGPEGGPRYFDSKRHPELLQSIEEVQRVNELGEFLSAVNSQLSILETAKCDAWVTRDLNPEEEIFGCAFKFGSYIDLVFSDDALCFSFEKHEQMAKQLTQLLKRVPDIPASAEFLIRRCYYHSATKLREGFYITFYLFGFGDDEERARRQWAVGLSLVRNAISQLSADWKRD
ncbi:MAG: hypothetical protein NVS1B11_15910 [Terriglobales bacterium]